MVRILYAINGDGMGHATRSTAIIEELRKKHKIRIVAGSERTYSYLKKKFSDVHKFQGIAVVYSENKVDDYSTFKGFIKNLIQHSRKNVKKMFEVVKKFNPEVIITDFEGLSAHIGNLLNIPVICLCNVHSVTKMAYPVPKKHFKHYNKSKLVINTIFPKADYHLITTFFYLPIKSNNVFLYPPVLRKELVKIKVERKDHILVYQTSKTNKVLIDALKSVDEKFIVYGFDENRGEKNLIFRKFNEKQFLKDFSQCKACISNGGFSLVSEAVSLHKPVLSIPVKGQFEQILNALHIQKLGYGELHDHINAEKIKGFISRCHKYCGRLEKFPREDNSRIIHKIEEIIDHDIRGYKDIFKKN